MKNSCNKLVLLSESLIGYFLLLLRGNKLSLLTLLLGILGFSNVLFSQSLQYQYHASDVKFIENRGQWAGDFNYRTALPNGKLFVSRNKLTYLFYNGKEYEQFHHKMIDDSLHCHAVQVGFVNSNPSPNIKTYDKCHEYYNYYLSRDTTKWATGVGAYKRLVYESLYEGIDAELLGYEANLKYNFYVSPGADPFNIQLEYKGANQLYIENGDLHITTSVNEFLEILPKAYQMDGTNQKPISCSFNLNNNVISFELPEGYDDSKPLVIDPVVIFSSYSGSYADNFGYSATYDDSGYAYSAGTVFDIGYPTTPGAFQTYFAGGIISPFWGTGYGRDIGILKYTPDGTNLVYGTYLGGSGNEDPHSMVVNHKYQLIVFGNSCSKDFPIGKTFYDSSYNGNYDIILAKFSTDGKSLLSSTYLGGSNNDALNGYFNTVSYSNQCVLGYNYGDVFRGEVIVDSNDNVYVATTTKSPDFPVTNGVFQPKYGGGNQDGCVFKLSPNLDKLLYSSFLGGNHDDSGYGIALDNDNNIYVCGGTNSTNLKIPAKKYKTFFTGNGSSNDSADGYVYHISKDFTTILSATYVGTNKYDQTYFVQTDQDNNVYVTGQTASDSFPVKNVKYFNTKGKQFIMKFNKELDSTIFSMVFGSGRSEIDLSPSAFLVDNCQRIYFSGWGGDVNHYGRNSGWTYGLTTTSDGFYQTTGGSDFYVAVFAKNVDKLLFATFWGDEQSNNSHVDGGTSRFDKKGIIYESVCASCDGYNSFPTSPANVHSHNNNSDNCNNAIFKINLNIPDLQANFTVDTIFCLADDTAIHNTSIGATSYYWSFGDGDTSTASEPKHVYADTGTYKIRLIVYNLFTCEQVDTLVKKIVVHDNAYTDFSFDTSLCINNFNFKPISNWAKTFNWYFGDNTISKTEYSSHFYKDTGSYKVTLITDSGTACQRLVTKTVQVHNLPKANFSYLVDTCQGKAIFTNSSVFAESYLWNFGDADTSQAKSPVHYYKAAGIFDIQFICEPGKLCADTTYGKIDIITAKADAILSIDTCHFILNAFNSSRYAQNKCTWYFGDGDSNYYHDTITHQYKLPNIYTLKLFANLGTICQDTVVKQLNIPVLPKASFTIHNKVCQPFFTFDNKSVNAMKYQWDFGNGQKSTTKDSVTIRYNNTGNYLVNLYATSAYSCIDTFTDTLQIDHLALADFDYKFDTCSTTVSLINKSTQSGQLYWNFGDSSILSSVTSPVHIYKRAGHYYISLVVRDAPCYDSISREITLTTPPVVDFTATTDSCSTLAIFKSISSGAIDYLWSFGDSNISHNQNINYIFKDKGTYKVKFYINFDTICKDSMEKDINITYEPKVLIIPNVFTPNYDGTNDKYYIRGLDLLCDRYKLMIYNRWGQLIFEGENDKMIWDGTYGGKRVSAGTYYFILWSSEWEKAGTITVIW